MTDRAPQSRVGIGLDVHSFAPGRRLVLGGVEVRYEQGLAGHSDGDALAHAIVDALLGAAGRGDIGQWFPSDDSRFAGADSLSLLRTVAQTLRHEGWRIVNVDATVIAEQPRLAEHLPVMRSRLAEAIGVGPEDFSVKATTVDGLGALGRAEGIAAQAVALITRNEK
ncbi:MAG TPA: 2-C-methyl-D-erythritol 2,4-cyclodiphosphate synthase [Chloroflexota bacterium]|nr:2-C-methyl-D-erythritol 2,4-cyclodiphosphate synthase [Chloroflexota bacterium]